MNGFGQSAASSEVLATVGNPVSPVDVGTFNYGDDISFKFSTGTTVTTKILWVCFVTGF